MSPGWRAGSSPRQARAGGGGPRPLAPAWPTRGEAGRDWSRDVVKTRPEKQSLGRLRARMGLMCPQYYDGTGWGDGGDRRLQGEPLPYYGEKRDSETGYY